MKLNDISIAEIKAEAQHLWQRANRWSDGWLGVIPEAIQQFGETQASQAAAALAYYTFFSLFPLLLVLVVISSFFLTGDQAYQETINFIQDAIPASQSLIEQNIRQVLELRGQVGLIGVVGLLWSASGAFSTLAYNIDLAWPQAEERNFLEKRLVALGMMGVIFLLLWLSLAATTLEELLPRLEIPLFGGVAIYETSLWAIAIQILPWLFSFLMFLSLYRWAPHTDVRWRAALGGAALGGLGWEVAKNGFAWYLRSGLANYQLVYGSLGTVVALLFWIYISGMLALFGAHLTAAIDHHLAQQEAQ
ncbi:MAG: YihY/virulence factor BrkB family protein [Anaerolineales bacterium]